MEQVAKMMVLPNKLPIKLSDEIPTVDLRMPEPEVLKSSKELYCTYIMISSKLFSNLYRYFQGVLRIHLVQAQNLMKKDVSMIGEFLNLLSLVWSFSLVFCG